MHCASANIESSMIVYTFSGYKQAKKNRLSSVAWIVWIECIVNCCVWSVATFIVVRYCTSHSHDILDVV